MLNEDSEKLWAEWRNENRVAREERARRIRKFDSQFDDLIEEVAKIAESLGADRFCRSLDRTLRQDFDVDDISKYNNGSYKREVIELEYLAIAHKSNTLYIVETTTNLRQDHLDQILDHLHRFPKFFPQLNGEKVFGILGATKIPQRLRRKALQEGLFLGEIRDNVFEIVRSEEREPRAFPA
jgi:hypothetical protein